ncbi:MAG TPA: DNA adenine methylase [Bacteroidales bacterium]|nr:DNA adenine methylase [Bacteroidales bacterium]
MKPPIKYFGGKSNMISKILPHFPPDSHYNIYLEPYGGSASVLLSRPLTGHVEIFNDINENIYSLFKCLIDPDLFSEFKNKCDLSLYSAQLRREYKEKLKEKLSLIDRAYYFWYVNRSSHNGIGGWSINCCIRRNMSKSTSDFLSSVDRLKELHDRLSAVIIEKRDAIELMKKYDDPSVFVYADPPYHPSTRGNTRYENDYTIEDHVKFINCVLELKSKVLISGYNNLEYGPLGKKFSRIDFDVKTTTGTHKKKTKTESLWKNY